jgi:hypothetical protein
LGLGSGPCGQSVSGGKAGIAGGSCSRSLPAPCPQRVARFPWGWVEDKNFLLDLKGWRDLEGWEVEGGSWRA